MRYAVSDITPYSTLPCSVGESEEFPYYTNVTASVVKWISHQPSKLMLGVRIPPEAHASARPPVPRAYARTSPIKVVPYNIPKPMRKFSAKLAIGIGAA